MNRGLRRHIPARYVSCCMLVIAATMGMLLGPVAAAFGSVSSESSSPEHPLYYYSGDLRVQLSLSLDEVMVHVPEGGTEEQEQAGAMLRQALPDAHVSVNPLVQRVLVQFEQAAPDRPSLQAWTADLVAAGYKVEGVAYLRGTPERTAQSRQVITPRLIVKPRPGQSMEDLADAYGLRILDTLGQLEGVYVAEVLAPEITSSIDIANSLYESDNVEYAQPELLREYERRIEIPNDPIFNIQWHLRNVGQRSGAIPGIDINALNAWTLGTGAGVNIVVVDDGLQEDHPDLTANTRKQLSWDYRLGQQGATPGAGDNHGTAVAGLAAAVGNNALGVTGVGYDASIIGVRLIGGPLSDTQIINGITHLVHIERPENRADISTNSWGPVDSQLLTVPIDGPVEDAIRDAIENGRDGKGVIYLWAAGNGRGFGDWANYDGYANTRYSIAVAATMHDGTYPYYSEPGSCVLITALGDGVATTDRTGANGYVNGDYFDGFNGTSASTPIAAGTVAIMLEVNPELTWRDVQHILVDTSRKNDPTHEGWAQNGSGRWYSHDYGYGLIDAGSAAYAASSWVTVPPEATPLEASSSPGLPIPDMDPDGVTDSVTIENDGSFFTEHVEVTVNISHGRQGDLRVELISPSGMTSILAKERPGNTANNLHFQFTSVAHWGEDPEGTWTLRVSDRDEEITGTLNSWDIKIHGYRIDDTLTNWAVTPETDFVITGTEGEELTPDSRTYTIETMGYGFNWAVGGIPSWLEVTPATSGMLTPGGSVQVTARLTAQASHLSPGDYQATLAFRNQVTGETAWRHVRLTVEPSESRPSVSGVSITPTNPSSDVPLQANYTFTDPNDLPEANVQVRWYRYGERLVQYDNLIELPAEATTGSEIWFVEVRVSNGTEWTRWAASPLAVIQNRAPVMEPIPPISAEQSEVIEFQVEAFDPDGDTLTYSMTLVPQNPNHHATNFAINSSTGLFRWNTANSSVGRFIATFRVADDGNPPLTAQQTVTITIGEFCPEPAVPSDIQASKGQFTDRVRITYNPVEGAQRYRVFRAESPDVKTATFIGAWPQTVFDDFSIVAPAPSGIECGGASPGMESKRYYYWVAADNGCKISAKRGPDSGYASPSATSMVKGVSHSVYESVIPSFELTKGVLMAPTNSELAIRLRAGESIDAESVWGVVSAGDWETDAIYWLPNNASDGWVVYWPTQPFTPGAIVTMTVGANTVTGQAVDPITYTFGIENHGEEETSIASKTANGDVTIDPVPLDSVTVPPAFDGAVGPAYRIAPDMVFDGPQDFLVPVPAGVSADHLQVYYHVSNGGYQGWYPADSVEGWLAASPSVESVDGVTHVRLSVTHSGVIRLGLTTTDTAAAGATGRRTTDLLLLFGACLALVAVGRKRALARSAS